MTTTITTLREKLRVDLKDPDDALWSDITLERHIQHAVLDISQALPLQQKDTGLTISDPATREIDISSITGLIAVDAVEYPINCYPKRYRNFKVWASMLELLIDELPIASASLYLYYGKVYTVDSEGSTLPSYLEDLCVMGAGAYAALEWASFSINQVNVGGRWTAQQYLSWANNQLERYQVELRRYRARNGFRVYQLYMDDTW